MEPKSQHTSEGRKDKGLRHLLPGFFEGQWEPIVRSLPSSHQPNTAGPEITSRRELITILSYAPPNTGLWKTQSEGNWSNFHWDIAYLKYGLICLNWNYEQCLPQQHSLLHEISQERQMIQNSSTKEQIGINQFKLKRKTMGIGLVVSQVEEHWSVSRSSYTTLGHTQRMLHPGTEMEHCSTMLTTALFIITIIWKWPR